MYQPLIAATFEDIIPVMGTPEEQKVVDEKYPGCENISVDYAILEKAEEIFVFPADFGWSDLGTWGSLQTLSKKDEDGNAIISQNVKLFESSNCIVNVEGAKQVAIQGLDGYIVAERDGRLLICKLADEQRIKEFSK
jgi:mannose-1-phosphate guanylyltransferase